MNVFLTCLTLVTRRGLNIGDFLWVAREKVQEVAGQYRQVRSACYLASTNHVRFYLLDIT